MHDCGLRTPGLRAPEHGRGTVDELRVLARIDELAAIGATRDGGVTRLAYSEEDMRAYALVREWLAQAEIDSAIDAAGNLLACVRGSDPSLGSIALGSHLDTVVHGGRLDGAYGVVAAVEAVVQVAAGLLPPRHDITLMVFRNEEGANGTPGMVGSHAIAGNAVDTALLDYTGVSLHEQLTAVGGAPERLEHARWNRGDLAAFLELHIEQGPTLEEAAVDIGIVTCITGRVNLAVTVTGRQQHAGTTPMALRCDALVVAARLIGAVDELARTGAVRVATTGRICCSPNVWNVIPGDVRLVVDLRDESADRLDRAQEQVRRLARVIAGESGASIDVDDGPRVEPVSMDENLGAYVAMAADQLSLTHLSMPSGAGHDAQLLAQIAPTVLFFVPSVGGISHAPEEASSDHHLVAGAALVLQTLGLLDSSLAVDSSRPVPTTSRPLDRPRGIGADTS